ncbi:MAG: RnfABCDGE type electron transport complex subunit D [Defluviitaleaceae bacterium]|nr:RnfABCDGE type electron transport complex subunit D [Defluviitaleaceae bacterium]
MKFPLKSAPHIQGKTKNSNILATVLKAALFVAVWSIFNRFFVFGIETALHIVFMIIAACAAGTAAHVIFYYLGTLKNNDFNFSKFTQKFTTGETVVTGLILALAMQSTSHLYAVVIVTLFAEIMGKLIFGGYGQNIFNPIAVGLVFNALAFGGTTLTVGALPDIVSAATPLAWLNSQNWIINPYTANNFILSSGGVLSMFLGTIPAFVGAGAIGETSRLALVLALCYMCYKKAADWTTPVIYVGVVFIIAAVYGFFIGAGFWYPVIHILTGGVIFGAVFLASDSVTIPFNRQGKAIFAILLAMFTMLIRFNTSHVEGVAFSIILMNMMVPFIDSKTLNITSKKIGAKVASVAITFAVALIFVVGFTILFS